MALVLVLVIFLKLFFCFVSEGSLINETISSSISLGSSLSTDTANSAWPSPSGLFAFGFYKQEKGSFAVGIWLTTKPNITVVWTANRDDPPLSSNSTIELSRDGWLLLHTTYGVAINLTVDQRYPATSASMFDSGNFVLYNDQYFDELIIWESFDHPCDTILGGQQLAPNYSLISSVSTSQHSSGRFKLAMQTDGNLVAGSLNHAWVTEEFYWENGAQPNIDIYLQLLPNGSLHLSSFDGAVVQEFYSPTTTSCSASINDETTTVVFSATLNPEGNFVLYSHIFTTTPTPSSSSSSSSNVTKEWSALQDPCQVKDICGVNSYCNSTGDKAECLCFPGFLFSSNTRYTSCYKNFTDEEAACSQRRSPLNLSYNITAMENMELAVYPYSVMNLSNEACSNYCLHDCNCWVGVYASGSCKLINLPIINAVLQNKSTSAPTVFIKTSYRDENKKVPAPTKPKQSKVEVEIVRVIAVTLGLLALMCTLVALSSFFYYRVHARRYQSISRAAVDFELLSDHSTLRSFSFDELEKATAGFKEVIARNSTAVVYKGFISDGKKAVAVKKLLQHKMMFEGGGRGGFRAEITAIAQTHHRNLVRLLGFCIHGATKLLVYEFMNNGSLADLLLTSPPVLEERMRVALDVARGIFYLHEECETRIIHCNIKPHNILFDESWTAKISDFGLSKLLRPNQSGSTLLTAHVRGTRGYLAPEWLKNTLITTKVDIYSFGVVLLEILCCTSDMKITGMLSDDITPLSTWVYNCFVTKEYSRLIGDEDDVDRDMLERMVKVGLLCIQDDQDARPSSKDVILMLEGTTDTPIPPSPTPPLLI